MHDIMHEEIMSYCVFFLHDLTIIKKINVILFDKFKNDYTWIS
jgi:hypothetical protein